MMGRFGLRLGVLGMVGLLLFAQPARAVEWFTDTGDGAVTTSAFVGSSSVAVRCDNGALSLAVKVRKADLDPALGSADQTFVLTTADPDGTGAASFTARATANTLGSSYAYVLSAKDSAARLDALQAAKTEMEFALLTEPGGARYNSFRLPVAGLAEALKEVLGACAPSPSQPAVADTSSSAAPSEAPKSESTLSASEWTIPSWEPVDDDETGALWAQVGSNATEVSANMFCDKSDNSLSFWVVAPASAFASADLAAQSQVLDVEFGTTMSFSVSPSVSKGQVTYFVSSEDADKLLDWFWSARMPNRVVFDIVSEAGRRLFHIEAGVEGFIDGIGKVHACRKASDRGQPPNAAPTTPETDGVWALTADDAGNPTARVGFQGSRLSFSCIKDEVYFFYDYPALNKKLVELDSLTIMFAIDPRADGTRSVHSVDISVTPGDADHFVAFKGEAAADWARIGKGANRVIEVSLTKPNYGASYTTYNVASFPAKGSTAAIKSLLAACT